MQKNKQSSQTDIVIVGAGPVGLGLAIDLAQFGVRTTVVERSSDLHTIPKGQNLTQRTGEHFRRWGVSRAIRQAEPIRRDFGNAGLVAYEKLLGDYHYDWFKRGAVNQFYFAENERLPQYETERVLRDRARQLDAISLHLGCPALDVEQNDRAVTVNVQKQDGQSFDISARYCVGCDGSRSRIRQGAGIEQTFAEHEKKMVLLVFKSNQLHELLERFPGKSIYNVLNPQLDGYWQFLGRVDLDGTWFYHSPVPAHTTRDNFDFEAHLHDVVGETFDLDFIHIGFWDLRIAVAVTYRNNRIFIAGDAAHSHPPYGGYGVNLGFEDARNLSWKLAATLNGWAGANLLDSYSLERRAVFQSTSQHFIGRMIEDDRAFIASYSPERDRPAFEAAWAERASGGNADVTQYLPHYEGSPITVHSTAGSKPETKLQQEPDGAGGARGIHTVRARNGHHLAPQPLSDGRDLFEALGNGFCLISLDGAPEIEQRFDALARNLSVPFNLIRDSRQDGREDYGARYILVRPDHFISWCGGDTNGWEEDILRRALGWGHDN